MTLSSSPTFLYNKSRFKGSTYIGIDFMCRSAPIKPAIENDVMGPRENPLEPI